MGRSVTEVFSTVRKKINDLLSGIDKDANVNPENKTNTVGHAKRAVSGFALIADHMHKAFEPTDEFLEQLEELEEKVEKMIQYNKKLDDAQKRDPNISIPDVLTPDEQKEFTKLSDSVCFVSVDNTRMPNSELYLRNQGIPYFKMASTNESATFIVADAQYAATLNQMRRVLAINQKYGLVDIQEFKQANDSPEKMQISNLDAWETQLYNYLMQEARIPGGLAYANNDVDNLKCNIVYRPEDHPAMQLISIKAQLIKAASLNPKSDLLLKNRLEGQFKDRIILAKAMEMSQFTNFYICSESVDKYVTLSKSGCALYVKGKKVEEYDRADLSEKDFKKYFEGMVAHVQNANMVVLQDKDLIPNRDSALATFNEFSSRKELLAKKHASTIDINTLNPTFLKELQRQESKPLSDLLEMRKKAIDSLDKFTPDVRTEIYIFKTLESYIEATNGIVKDSLSTMLSNTEGKPSLDMIVCNTQDYARLYAEYATLNTRLLSSQETEQTKLVLRDQLDALQTDLLAEQTLLKESIEAFKSAYDIPDDILDAFVQGVSINCGAVIDTTGKPNFSQNIDEVNAVIAKTEALSTLLGRVSENLQEQEGQTNVEFGGIGDKINEEVVKDDIEKDTTAR